MIPSSWLSVDQKMAFWPTNTKQRQQLYHMESQMRLEGNIFVNVFKIYGETKQSEMAIDEKGVALP